MLFFLNPLWCKQTFPFNAEHLRATTAWAAKFPDLAVALAVAAYTKIVRGSELQK